ncbi:ABC transporter substrate-binding protein [Helicobacter sp. 13S00477-4]|uniref:ABC transporter substrate-binding protein n=1 Tax=Helicobacter sp. 13S00477-4 TaxID=1905759 RepID=UPI000BD64BFB|nr:ABC transporter substrate-binding protein [Helicobacter sp. 13S00477-4]PAF52689.1 hypothetical protein BKH44_00455 [Helicobacter sp. 13S00477-4]
MHRFLRHFNLFFLVFNSFIFANTLEIKDFFGTHIVKLPIKKLAIIGTYLELPAMFNIWDKVIALDKYSFDIDINQCFFKLNENKIYKMDSNTLGNIEKLLQIKPDLIISSIRNAQNIIFGNKIGLNFLSFQTHDIDAVKKQIFIFASLFDKIPKAKIIIQEMDSIFQLIEKQTSKITQKKKAIFVFNKPNVVSGKISVVSDMLNHAFVDNIGSRYITHDRSEIPIEKIVKENPDIIFIWWLSHYDTESILKIPALQSVKAIKTKQVYKMPSFDGTGPRVALMSLFVAMNAYPQNFKNINIQKTIRDFYLRIYGYYICN